MKKTTQQKRILLQTGLLALAVLFMAVGWAKGEVQMVLEKSVNICLECIGIG